MIKCTPIDLNPADLDFYLFMINRDKCNASCNGANDLSKSIFQLNVYVPSIKQM